MDTHFQLPAQSVFEGNIHGVELDLFLEGDDKTWELDDWSWDPYHMHALPKQAPSCVSCQAFKRQKLPTSACASRASAAVETALGTSTGILEASCQLTFPPAAGSPEDCCLLQYLDDWHPEAAVPNPADLLLQQPKAAEPDPPLQPEPQPQPELRQADAKPECKFLPDGVLVLSVDESSKMVCQVPGCGKDLTELKDYHQRYRICDVHIKLPQIMKDGRLQRFCQQCGRFHDLSAFDGNRKSCREQLSKHNARRRRRVQDTPGFEGAAAAFEDKSETGKLLQSLWQNPMQLQALRLMLGMHTNAALPRPAPAPAEHTALFHSELATVKPQQEANVRSEKATSALDVRTPKGEEADPASYRIAREVADSQGQYSSHFEPEHKVVRLSMKLFNTTPADLPGNLREQIVSWLGAAPISMEAYIRPGCVLLTVQCVVSSSCYGRIEKDGMTSLLQLLTHPASSIFWKRVVMIVQLLEHVAVLVQGQVVSTTLYSASHMQQKRLPHLTRVSPLCVVSHGTAVQLKLFGTNLDHADCVVLCRSQGQYLRSVPKVSNRHGVQIELEGCAPCKTLEVEVALGAFLSTACTVLVVDDHKMAEEINRLEDKIGSVFTRDEISALLMDLGLILRHVSGQCTHGLAVKSIVAKAHRVLAFACDHALVAVARALLPLASAPCTDVRDIVARVHEATAQRDQLTLLHRAVRSKSLVMVKGILSWGEAYGYRWPVDQGGPNGISPLHLAALCDDEGPITLALLDCCGPSAFTTANTVDGVTPFHLALQMGHFCVDKLLAYVASGSALAPALVRGRVADNPSDTSTVVDPCSRCHSTLPPLMLSVIARCNTCGIRKPCTGGADGTGQVLLPPPLLALICSCESAALGMHAEGCAARPPVAAEVEGPCSGHGAKVVSITAMCQSCHSDRVIEVA